MIYKLSLSTRVCISGRLNLCRGEGGQGGQGPPKFSENTKKCPFSGGKVPFAFVKNVVQIAFLTHGSSSSLCGHLSVGQLNNEK